MRNVFSVQRDQQGHATRAGRSTAERYNDWSARVPRGCLMPIRAVLLTAILCVGVLPLYFHTMRDSDLTYATVCGMYPDSALSDGEWVNLAAPPAPPGAHDIRDPTQCDEDFRVFFDDYGIYSYSSPWAFHDFIAFVLTVEDLDAKKRTASAKVLAYPTSTYSGLLGTITLPPSIVLSMSVNAATPDEYKDGDSFISGIPKKTDSIPVNAKPDLSFYPFDRYRFEVAVILKFINMSDNNSTSFVPFVAVMETRNPAFSFTTPTNAAQTALLTTVSGFSFAVEVTRTSFTKAFSIFVFIAMWVLTVFSVVHAVDVVFVRKDRPVTFEAPAFAATLLFALPAVRQVQPGVPDVGAIIDVIGFFWNMVLLALVCCLYISLIYAQHVQGSQEQQALKAALDEDARPAQVQAVQSRRAADVV